MQITGTSIYERRDITLDIEGGPTVTKLYGKRKFLVERLVLHYRRIDGKPWKWGSTDVAGRYVLKDGALGEGTSDNYYTSYESKLAELGLGIFAETHMPTEVSAS